MRPLWPGEVVALGMLAGALAADVVLIHLCHEPISTCVRRSTVGRVVVAALAAHLCFSIPNDPLTWAGRRLSSG
jgi:hypothetical protein